MEENFNVSDLCKMYELIYTLRKSTIPLNEHTDPLSINDCWDELNNMVYKMGMCFKNELFSKEYIEELHGITVQRLEKVYDENGILTTINVVPYKAAEFINLEFKIISENENKQNI